MTEKLLTLGEVADYFSQPLWRIRRLYILKHLPPAQRVGPYRVVPESELPLVRSALIRAKYIEEPNGESQEAETRNR